MLSATDLIKEPKVVQPRPPWKDGVKVRVDASKPEPRSRIFS